MDVESQNSDTVYSQHLGLHHYCNTALPDKPCRTFPDEEKDCDPNDRYFCSMWRTTGFLMSFATVAELATLVCFVVAIGGGSVKREYGWKVLCGLLTVVSVVQFAAMGLVVSLLLLSRGSVTFDPDYFTIGKTFGLLTLAPHSSRSFTITMNISPSQAGDSTRLGSCVPLALVWLPYSLVPWHHAPTSCRQKTMATISSTTPSTSSPNQAERMGDSWRIGFIRNFCSSSHIRDIHGAFRAYRTRAYSFSP